ncbi:DUF3822 family protein [Elizabethkingia sp. JS20170427COW]|uniref:DUF3822 family protein n=1 Tax=Elizabethkingia sp. JS20170427COW TaxID=2583851 RepID=UPI001110FAED|nr:DUF3822 family protein [Elizabethkingia sp. JS20170427COW]QCX53760.1 DUF3822 family protein [Elizabethkingia sp. JS20170427COW]
MQKLSLLFTKDTLQWASGKGSGYQEKFFYKNEEKPENYISQALQDTLQFIKTPKLEIISALNHFALTPYGFDQHEMGFQLISYNAPVDENNEELMLAINKKHHVQFYYTMPKEIYKIIKSSGIPSSFNFSGEKFLSSLSFRSQGEQFHINLYENQAEFFAIKDGKILLYNNLDSDSEVDFLYFIMFSVSKLGFNLAQLQFLIYGEVDYNDTFMGELQKFSRNVKVIQKNIKNKNNFILQ